MVSVVVKGNSNSNAWHFVVNRVVEAQTISPEVRDLTVAVEVA